MKTALGILIALTGLACTTTSGRKISQKEYDDVILKRTTGADILKNFGEPTTQVDQRLTQWDFENKKFPDCGKTGETLTWYAYTYGESERSRYRMETRNFVTDSKGLVCNKNSSVTQQKAN
jgi:hypothetical protein